MPAPVGPPPLTPAPECEWCGDTGLVDDHDLPETDDTPKPCEHCWRGTDCEYVCRSECRGSCGVSHLIDPKEATDA